MSDIYNVSKQLLRKWALNQWSDRPAGLEHTINHRGKEATAHTFKEEKLW